MAEPFIGEIRMFPFDFAPRGWALCNGQLLAIAQNQALFSILGTTYGGDGRTTFALPDLRGRVAVHAGDDIALGEMAGEETHTLRSSEMPAHTHLLSANNAAGSSGTAAGNVWAGSDRYNTVGAPDTTLSPSALASSGGSQPHDNMQPYLVASCCIALTGIFPSRS